MRRSRYVLFFGLLAFCSDATNTAYGFASDPAGTWTAVFHGDPLTHPKMLSAIRFEFAVEGETLTGMVRMGHWPGDAPISDGRIEDARISFTAVGSLPWCSSGGLRSGCGYPKLQFRGIVDGDELALTVDWGSILDGEYVSGAEWPAAGFRRPLDMKGRRERDRSE